MFERMFTLKRLTNLGNIIRSAGTRGPQHHLAGDLRGQLVRGAFVVARTATLLLECAGWQWREFYTALLRLEESLSSRLRLRLEEGLQATPLGWEARGRLARREHRQPDQQYAAHPHSHAHHAAGTKCTGR